MRIIWGTLSLLSFVGVVLITLIFVSNPPSQPLFLVLALIICFGCTILFRGLRNRLA